MGIIAENFDTIEGDIEVGVERLVGTFKINGTVYNRYVKVVDCGQLPNNNTKTVAHGITGIVGVLSFKGCAHNSVNGNFIPLPHVGTDMNYMVSVYINSTTVYITPLGNYNNYTKSYIIIEYYK